MTLTERLFGRHYGAQPDIVDGVRGEALVLESVASLPPSWGTSGTYVGSWKAWAWDIPLLVQIPGRDPYPLSPRRWMWREKYPIGGTTLPVTVARDDPAVLRIEWDEVPAIDAWMAGGHPVFTDPQAAQDRLREVRAQHVAAIEREVGRKEAEMMTAARGLSDPADVAQVERVLAGMRAREEAENPGVKLKRRPIEGASGRVLAVGTMDGGDDEAPASMVYGEVLLSVAIPGEARYGARTRGWIHNSRPVYDWGDVPVEVDAAKPGKVRIRWGDIPGAASVISEALSAGVEQMEAKLAKLNDAAPATTADYADLLSMIRDPEQRAQAERSLAQGLSGGGASAAPARAPAAPADPLDQLEALVGLRDAGALTEDEFTAEKARLLGGT